MNDFQSFRRLNEQWQKRWTVPRSSSRIRGNNNFIWRHILSVVLVYRKKSTSSKYCSKINDTAEKNQQDMALCDQTMLKCWWSFLLPSYIDEILFHFAGEFRSILLVARINRSAICVKRCENSFSVTWWQLLWMNITANVKICSNQNTARGMRQ